jgi:hypothetical protein
MTKKEKWMLGGGVALAVVAVGAVAYASSTAPPAASSSAPPPTPPPVPPTPPPLPPSPPAPQVTQLIPGHRYSMTVSGLPPGATPSTQAEIQNFFDRTFGQGLFGIKRVSQNVDGSITALLDYNGSAPFPVASLIATSGAPMAANFVVTDLGPIPPGDTGTILPMFLRAAHR